MTILLERMIFSYPPQSEAPEAPQLLALSEALTPSEAALWRGVTSLQPLPVDAASQEASCAYGIFAGPGDRFVLARACLSAPPLTTSRLYDYLLIPRDSLQALAGNLDALLKALVPLAELPALLRAGPETPPRSTNGKAKAGDAGRATAEAQIQKIARVTLPELPPWPQTDALACFKAVLAEDFGGDFRRMLVLLEAALHDRGLMIHEYPLDSALRLRLVQGLLALLPAPLRSDLTFSTNRHERETTQARVVFAARSVTSARWVADWEKRTFPGEDILKTAYVRRLAALWTGEADDLVERIAEMSAIAATLQPGKMLRDNLALIADRHALDARIEAGEPVEIETLKRLWKSIPPGGDLKLSYARQLLERGVEDRDVDAAALAAAAMDDDPALDAALYPLLDAGLLTQPDAIYAFVRTRLSAQPDERWLLRLKAAALASLQIAIADGDAETVINWLKLVAREPVNYDLADILHHGILSAQARARTDPDLAFGLVLLAVKRDQAALDPLLEDDALVEALPEPLARALRDHEGDPEVLLQNHGPELFLVALARAARAMHGELFTPLALDQVWGLYTSSQMLSLSSHYNPEQIINTLVENGIGWMSAAAQQHLLALVLRDQRDELFFRLAHGLRKDDERLGLLAGALDDSGRDPDELLALIGQMVAIGDVTQPESAQIYITLLEQRGWSGGTLPLMQQLARIMQQHPNLTVPADVIWMLLRQADEHEEEFITRLGVRWLSGDLEKMSDDNALVDAVLRLYELIQWDAGARQAFHNWWRDFVRDQTLARLQRIDKALDGKRPLEEARTIVQWVITLRKVLGKRTITQFADDIATTYAILQALSESFDPSTRRPSTFDALTMRAELDSRSEELSPHQQQILANNFKELAHLIASMGDSRSRASIMRRGEDLDRQLISGEQPPHSAVDALKWMAGYLSGAQNRDDDDE